MAPHLMRVQGAYKADKHATHTCILTYTQPPPPHTHTCTHTHTHIHTPCKNTSIVVMGLMETEESEKSVGRREEVDFQF